MIADACRTYRRALLVDEPTGSHATACDACTQFRNRELATAAIVRGQTSTAPIALYARVMASIEAARNEREPHRRPRSRRRIMTTVAAIAAIAAGAVISIVALGGTEHARIDHGVVVATAPQHLDLDSVTADLEPGATVSWQRDRLGVHVEQAGAARWMVARTEQLRIDAGAMAVSVAATGASLRVEVPVNISDARVIGASALTAAAVAFVTVVVYEGHVTATSSSQTVTVEPGSTVQLRAGQPPTPPAPPTVVGAADSTAARVHELELELQKLRDQLAAMPHVQVPVTLDRAAVEAALRVLGPDLSACAGNDPKLAAMTVGFVIRPDGTIERLRVPGLDPVPGNDGYRCIALVLGRAHFPRAQRTTSIDAPLRLAGDPLDIDAVANVIAPIKDQVAGCVERANGGGRLEVDLHIRPDGHDEPVVAPYADASLESDALAMCVTRPLEKLVFPATKTGRDVHYAFHLSSNVVATTHAAVPNGSNGCDEVSCVLTNYDGPCCRAFKVNRPATPSALSDALDRTSISNGIARMRPLVDGCGERSSVKGNVKIHVMVDGGGRVTKVVVLETPDANLGACVANVIEHATFAATQHGGSFSYPFIF